jgi:hypothetical protein
MMTALYERLLLDENFRENFMKRCGTMTMNLHELEEIPEEDDLIIYAVENLQAQDFVDMCEVRR